MDVGSVGQASTLLAEANLKSDVSIALISKSIDANRDNGAAMVKMLEQSVNPSVGQNIDISL